MWRLWADGPARALLYCTVVGAYCGYPPLPPSPPQKCPSHTSPHLGQSPVPATLQRLFSDSPATASCEDVCSAMLGLQGDVQHCGKGGSKHAPAPAPISTCMLSTLQLDHLRALSSPLVLNCQGHRLRSLQGLMRDTTIC